MFFRNLTIILIYFITIAFLFWVSCRIYSEGFEAGFVQGAKRGQLEGYEAGYKKGTQIGEEVCEPRKKYTVTDSV